MSNMPAYFYLQGGPGLNCVVERTWFDGIYPVLWWEQPRFSADAGNAYQATVNAAAGKLAELYAEQSRPIHIVSWSFGARLALDLAHRMPNRIGSLTLLAPTFCLATAFSRLTEHLRKKGLIDDKQHAASVRKACDHEQFMQQAMTLLSIPNLFSHYWAQNSRELSERHAVETSNTDWFDLPTFTAVSRYVFPRKPAPLPTGQLNNIRILAGRHDPYFDPAVDLALWNELFPGVSIQVVNTGHMIPFELPVVEWLNAADPGSF